MFKTHLISTGTSVMSDYFDFLRGTKEKKIWFTRWNDTQRACFWLFLSIVALLRVRWRLNTIISILWGIKDWLNYTLLPHLIFIRNRNFTQKNDQSVTLLCYSLVFRSNKTSHCSILWVQIGTYIHLFSLLYINKAPERH